MKYLELDSRTEFGRKYIRTLIGSPVDTIGTYRPVNAHLMGMDERFGIYTDMVEYGHIVLLPLNTLKICPYIAIRERIHLSSWSQHFGEVSGPVRISGQKTDGSDIFILTQNGLHYKVEDDFSLALEPILLNTLAGVRIVEVDT